LFRVLSRPLGAYANIRAERLLRQVAADRLIKNNGHDVYASTPWAHRVGSDPEFVAMYDRWYHEITGPMYLAMPSYFTDPGVGHKNPTDTTKGIYQHAFGKDSSFFGLVASDPVLSRQFASVMGCKSEGFCTPWVDVYDTSGISSARTDRPLVVDIGGSKGHDLERFLRKHPDVPDGSVVLQDLAETFQNFTINSRIKLCPYDFFTPQPIKGAYIYFLHAVLHDWPEQQAVEILRVARDGMEPGYSKLLIYDMIMSEESPSLDVTTMDLTMMAIFPALERTEKQWTELVALVGGLRVVKFWSVRQSVESVIEIERV
jgi:hypothetical protein